MTSFMHQEQVIMSGKPTQAVPVSSTHPNGHTFDANNVLGDLYSAQETFASQVTDKVDASQHTKDELFEDMQELFKDEAAVFGELHEFQELNELSDFRKLDELLKPIDLINEDRPEFISNSGEFEQVVPAKPEEKKLEIASHCPIQVSNNLFQTSHRPIQATHRPAQAVHLPVQSPHVSVQVTQVPVQATVRPARASRRAVQATHRPAQGSRRPPKPSCPPVQVSNHRPTKASYRQVQASHIHPPKPPCRPVLASHHRPPKVPYQPVQVSHHRPPKAPSRPVRASQHPPPTASYARASQRTVQGSARVGEVTAEQILEYLAQPPAASDSPRDMAASMMVEGHHVSNPRVSPRTPASTVSPSSMNAPLTVEGHPVPRSRGLHEVNNITAAPSDINESVAVRSHLIPRSEAMQQQHIPLTRNINASAVLVTPRVSSSGIPRYQNVNHAAMGLSLQSQMLQNPNVPVGTPTALVSGQETPYNRGSRMNQNQTRGPSGLKRKLRQDHPPVARKRTPDTNGATFIPGSAPVTISQAPTHAIPVQQNAYPIARESFDLAPGQAYPLQQMAYAVSRGVLPSTPVQSQPVQQNGHAIKNSQMGPPRPRRKTEQPSAGSRKTGQPSTGSKKTGQPSAGPSKASKPAKPSQPSKPPRAPRGASAAQNAAKRKANAPAGGTERPKKRTRTRIEDLDPAAVHVCDYEGCTKKFAKKYNLKIHQRRHTGDLPFTCDQNGCEKRFMWLSSFSRHSRVHDSKGKGGRKKRESQAEAQEGVDVEPAEEPDIAISDSYSIFSIGRLQHLVENEKSEEVTLACSMTALDAKPCQNLVQASKNAQLQRHNYLCGARAEEFYQYLTTPYHVGDPQLQTFCQVLTAATDPDRYIQDPTALESI